MTLPFIIRHSSFVISPAFRGELIPQDPNDEPAEALLERLRSEQGSGHVWKGRRMAEKSA